MDSTENDIIRVILTGAHSTGKTTLLEDVTKALPMLKKESEIARQIIKCRNIHMGVFKDPSKHEHEFYSLNLEILEKQVQLDSVNCENKQDYIVDRGLDPVVYVWQYLGEKKRDEVCASNGFKEYVQRLKNGKCLIFLITPHKECIKPDGVRMPPVFAELVRYTDLMEKFLRSHRIHFQRVEVLDRQQRQDIVTKEVLKIWKKNEETNTECARCT